MKYNEGGYVIVVMHTCTTVSDQPFQIPSKKIFHKFTPTFTKRSTHKTFLKLLS